MARASKVQDVRAKMDACGPDIPPEKRGSWEEWQQALKDLNKTYHD